MAWVLQGLMADGNDEDSAPANAAAACESQPEISVVSYFLLVSVYLSQ
jgi:hypothetical protein